MTIIYDTTGIKPTGGFEPVPKGNYRLRIVKVLETKSKSGGDPQVIVDFEVDSGEYMGHQIRFHRVTFLRPEREGAGIAVHFLKVIGEPYEGSIQIDAERWLGKVVRASVDVELDYNNNPRNVIRKVGPFDPSTEEEEVPF